MSCVGSTRLLERLDGYLCPLNYTFIAWYTCALFILLFKEYMHFGTLSNRPGQDWAGSGCPGVWPILGQYDPDSGSKIAHNMVTLKQNLGCNPIVIKTFPGQSDSEMGHTPLGPRIRINSDPGSYQSVTPLACDNFTTCLPTRGRATFQRTLFTFFFMVHFASSLYLFDFIGSVVSVGNCNVHLNYYS